MLVTTPCQLLLVPAGPDMTDLAAAAASLGAMKVTKSLPGGSAFGVAPATSSSHEDSEGRQSPTASQPSSSGIARVLATGPPELSNGEAVARSLGVAASERDAVADAEAPKASLEQMDALLQVTARRLRLHHRLRGAVLHSQKGSKSQLERPPPEVTKQHQMGGLVGSETHGHSIHRRHCCKRWRPA